MTAKTRRFAFLCSFLWDHTFWIFMLPGLDNSWQVLQDSKIKNSFGLVPAKGEEKTPLTETLASVKDE